MPVIAIDSQYRSESIFDLDRLKLKLNERARIVLPSNDVEAEYTHYIQVQQGDKLKGGYYQCLGDPKIVGVRDGVDPDRCPACREASPNRGATISTARRRLVTYVIRYRTKGNGEVIKPISLGLEVWIFGDDKYNTLVSRRQEHGSLAGKDIVITCKSAEFQQMDIDVSSQKPVYSTDAAAKAALKTLLGQRQKTLSRLLCTPMTVGQYDQLLDAAPRLGHADVDATLDDAADSLSADALSDDDLPLSIDDTPVSFDELEAALNDES